MLKPKSELDLINLMQHELVKNANNQDFSNLEQAIDYLNSAIDTLEGAGFSAYADRLLTLIIKIAATNRRNVIMERPPFETPPGLFDEPMITSASRKYKPKNPTNVSKRHSEKFVKNLKETGTMFSKKDFNMADDLLNTDIEFEDEDDPELEV